MGKHIIDTPRKRDERAELEHFGKIERSTSGRPGPQSRMLHRETRSAGSDEKLRRFTEIDRRTS
jgi:hypothetical protein